ncbi:uncharacterized protein LOC111394024 [Olea europaea var. sylvestris]|uniref:uncharacterized protein LOC111394024 n=1 Tax=Olea europaea var. sylvestris TaxID=158386 RepID=UPI000C1D245D|nr:uncharacterized protein LOC111394024 [Olea europaea var. sylvestris]
MSIDVMQLSDLELEPRGRLAPVEELEVVELEHGKTITIGRDLKASLREEVINCLFRNIDVFAWKVEDMPGIGPEVAVHRLNISPGAKPVKQRKRQFAPERRVVIQEEVGKLVRVREVQYPDWLANVVLVKKASGKWKVCIDFTDLNKACPKDSYPLPRIDNLVDSTSGHKLYIFLDAFLGYHQILIAEEDQEKTSFMADLAIYCYRVMLFGLKNAGAIYQRLISKVFADLIGKNIEAYVDDMVVKSKKVERHISDLEEVFTTLQIYRMKLNPEKCVFGVASGKFLGFMITHGGIEANPDKILALTTMESPRTKKECEKAFQELKQTLASPPILTKPEPGDTLLLYLAVSQNAVSGVLVKEPDISGRLLKWAIELGEFDIEFKPHPSIKVQALADFIAELTPRPWGPDDSSSTTTDVWQIFVDRASNSSDSGVGVIITSPNMLMDIQCAFRFEFEVTNNKAEYEDVIIALELAISLELESIKIFSDSQLVRYEIVKIARADNCKANALSRVVFMGVDGLDRTVHVRFVTKPSINLTVGVMDIDHEPSWMAQLSLTLPYVRCLKPSESSQVLEEVHEGVCGNLQGARALAFKLISISYLAPFEQWEIDILGPFSITRGQLKFVVVAAEYFTKWVEAQPLATISEPKIKTFVWRSIICRFGISKVLITNNGQQFNNAQFKDFCSSLGIDHRLTSVSHPQSNGLAEVTNRIILQDLRTRIGDARGAWSDELPSILWTYRTSHRTATGETPFMLAFRIEATIPIEIRLPSKRRLDLEEVVHTTKHLNLLEKVRDQAALRMASYQDRTSKYFNRKVRPRRFRAGDLVLRRAEATGHAPGKFGPVWV